MPDDKWAKYAVADSGNKWDKYASAPAPTAPTPQASPIPGAPQGLPQGGPFNQAPVAPPGAADIIQAANVHAANQERLGAAMNRASRSPVPVTNASALLALPSIAAEAIPSTARAGETLGAVRAAIGDKPIELSTEAQQAASRAYELGQRGSRPVTAINKFMQRMTKPGAEPLSFGEARDWYSGMKPTVIERLSTSGSIQKSVAEFKVALGDSIKDTAQREGMLKTYEDAMQEYHRAAVMKAVLAGAGGGAIAKYAPSIAALKYLVGSK